MNESIDLVPFRDDVIAADPLRMVGTRCVPQGHISFPRRDFCPRCMTEDVEGVDLPSTGRLHTFTVISQAPKGVDVPYMLGYVDLDDGIRLMSRVITSPQQLPTIGDRVRLVPFTFAQHGNDQLGFAFEIAQENS